MAFMNQDRKNALAPSIKAILKKYGMKGTLAVDNYSTLVLNIKEGPIDFDGDRIQVNTFWTDTQYTGTAKAFLREVIDAMNVGNHDNSDIMTDYFDVGWYVNVNVGKWNKPYVCTKKVLKAA